MMDINMPGGKRIKCKLVQQPNNRMCATCSLWGGARYIEYPFGNRIGIDSLATLGTCMATRTPRSAGASCAKWTKMG